MSNTYRWYSVRKAGAPLELKSFRRSLNKASAPDAWFSVGEDTIKFHRKIQIVLPNVAGDGLQTSQEIETVTSVEFAVFEVGQKTLLRIINPGRNMSALMTGIERAVGGGFSAKPLTFEKIEPVSILNRSDIKRVVGVKLVNVAITNDCVARMEFASKTGVDIRRLPLLRGLRYKIDYIKYEIVINGQRGAFSYTAGGLMKVNGVLSELIVKELQRDLAKSS